MNAVEILDEARTLGLVLAATAEGRLAVEWEGESAPPPGLLDRLKTHRTELLLLLSDQGFLTRDQHQQVPKRVTMLTTPRIKEVFESRMIEDSYRSAQVMSSSQNWSDSRRPISPSPASPVPPPMHSLDSGIDDQARVTISDREFVYDRRWNGRKLQPRDGLIALDTETDVVDLKRAIPRLAIVSASAGEQDSCLIHPDDVGCFILAHKNSHIAAHNAAFDFWVVDAHLAGRVRALWASDNATAQREQQARWAWWLIADQNRLHDSMLVDMLVRLALNDEYPRPRDLGTVAREYAGLSIDKDDPYRMRYGELIGADWSTIDPGFFSYAMKDAIATLPTYMALFKQAVELTSDFRKYSGDIHPDAFVFFGPLSEAIQVKKAIALAQTTRNGMRVDIGNLRATETDLRNRLAEAVAKVRAIVPEMYKTDSHGNLRLTGTAKAPSKSMMVLTRQLENVKTAIETTTETDLLVPVTTKGRKLTTSRSFWEEYRNLDPFLDAWITVEETTKLLQFFAHLREEEIHSSYVTMVRTGRTACSGPNIQQIPRDGSFRQSFVASPGHFLLAVDYSFIELRTLAAHTLYRYGSSRLAEVIKSGVDPHVHTAAMMLHLPPEQFMTWRDSEAEVDGVQLKKRFAQARQAAKAINFGVPGGLGVASLITYARSTYGVELTKEEAQRHRDVLTKLAYPELDLYLAENSVAILSRNLHADYQDVYVEFRGTPLAAIRKVLSGEAFKSDGAPYQPIFVERVWGGLTRLNRNADLAAALGKRRTSPELADRVCQAGVATLTGRIRGRVGYSQARNTPFQGLAADGASLALFALVSAGFRVVGFVHDEILIELPDEGGFVALSKVRRIEDIMCRSMERVLIGGIPVACESALSLAWSKKAKLVVQGDRVIPWELAEGTVPLRVA